VLSEGQPARESGQDYQGLRTILQQIKSRIAARAGVIREVGPEVDYQALVSVMDTVRSYPAVVAASVVEAELFPDVSLMDADENRSLAARPESAEGEGA